MTAATDGSSRGRGRPRDPSYDEKIRRATSELLGAEGYQGLTMAAVARRAGVAKTTIYRRWDTKAQMVLDTIGEQLQLTPEETTREPDDPVDALREMTVRFYSQLAGDSHDHLPVTPAELLAETEIVEVFRSRFLEPLREHGARLVERARRQGRLQNDSEPIELVDILLAPALYCAVGLRTTPSPRLAQRVFEALVD